MEIDLASLLKFSAREATTMGRKHLFPKLSVLSFLISQTFVTVPAFAAGFQINEISPALQGSATAGSAAANDDVSAMFINPATLGTLLQNQLYVGGSEIMPNIHVNNANATHAVIVPGPIANIITAPVQGATSQNSVSSAAFVPETYLGYRINAKLVAGIAMVAPFGLTTSYDNDSVLRFMADNSAVKAINFTPSIAYEVNQKWSLGLGLQVQYLSATFSNFNGTYTGTPLDAALASNFTTYAKGSGWGFGYTLGALFHPQANTHLGIGFRSQVSEALKGRGRQYVVPGPVTPAPSNAFLSNASSSVYASIKTPAVLTMSAAQDIGNWTVKGSAQVNFWKSFNQLGVYMPDAFATNSTIQTHWKNSWLASIGTDYRYNHKWTLRTGVAYDETPTQSAYRDARIPDSDRVWLAGGFTFNFNQRLSLDGTYTHLFIRNQSINVTQALGSSVNSTAPLEVNHASADYKGSADIVGLAVRYRL